MAVAAKTPSTGNPSSLMVLMIVFLVLAVLSLGVTIWMYTGQEELTQKKEAAEKNAMAASQKEQEARATLTDMSARLLGKGTDDPAEVNRVVEEAASTLFGKESGKMNELQAKIADETRIKRSDPLLVTLDGLYKGYQTQSKLLEAAQAEQVRLTEELAQSAKNVQETQTRFAAEAEAIKEQLANLEKQVADHHASWEQSLARLRQQSQAEADKAGEQLAAERNQRRTIEQQLSQNKTRVDELVATLSKFRPSTSTTSLLQIADGSIVQTVPGDRVVYIDLGARDHIKPGMTFAVYSRIRGIPADGKGKATVRVNNVFETTSECQVTTFTTADPVVEGDVVANPVYDRNRRFNFVVAGDFDLTFDGNIDDPEGEQVRKMVQEWGGSLVSTVDTRTDFVVLGAAPSVGVSADEARQHFDAIKNEARSLGIPILTRTQFLSFVGFGIPRNAKDDERPI